MTHRIIVFLMTFTIALIGPQRPVFDVASIKPTPNGVVKAPSATTINPNGVTFLNVTALDCIIVAYRIKDYQVTGPDWMKSDRYDIVAKAAGTVSDADVRLMLQTLLAERFKLASHSEMKELPIFALVLGKEVQTLRPTQGGPENSFRFDGSKLAFRNYSMASFAQFLSRLPSVDRPMVDMTALQGGFDFDVSLDVSATDIAAAKRAMLEWPTMLSDLQRQLGLKVDARKAATETLVVDHIEKPTPN